MPRSPWNGTISVGLINVPVKLYLDNGKSVVVTDADLEAVAPRRTRTIDMATRSGRRRTSTRAGASRRSSSSTRPSR
jgi:non-homologous end joining protein Ku